VTLPAEEAALSTAPAAGVPSEAAAGAAKSSDGVAQALRALAKRYKDSDKTGLATCLKTLCVYIENLARNPHEPKFQRINCENKAFQTRVAAYDGAVEVLLACGFEEESGALFVGEEFVKSKGSRLWDALAKLKVMRDMLE